MGYFFSIARPNHVLSTGTWGTFHLVDISSLRKHADHHLDLDRDVFRQ
jgi:hypothetical protein